MKTRNRQDQYADASHAHYPAKAADKAAALLASYQNNEIQQWLPTVLLLPPTQQIRAAAALVIAISHYMPLSEADSAIIGDPLILPPQVGTLCAAAAVGRRVSLSPAFWKGEEA